MFLLVLYLLQFVLELADLLIFFFLAHISDIANSVVVSLTLEHLNNSINGIRLELLYLKIKFHYSTFLTVSGLYVAKICSKFVATLSFVIELSLITK